MNNENYISLRLKCICCKQNIDINFKTMHDLLIFEDNNKDSYRCNDCIERDRNYCNSSCNAGWM